MTTPLNGLLGGLLIGLVAGAATRLAGGGSVTGRSGGGDTPASRLSSLAGQVLYGGLAGGALVIVDLYALDALGVPPALGEALGVAVAWSALLFAFWAVALRVGLSLPAASSLRELAAYHLVFGVGMGLWIRLTWIT